MSKIIGSISIFTNKDKNERVIGMEEPYLYEGYLYNIYDSSCVVRVKDPVDHSYISDDKNIERKKVVAGYYSRKENIFMPIPVSALNLVLEKVGPDVSTSCDTCDGEGEHDCPHCGQTMKCDDCDGDCVKTVVKRVKIGDKLFKAEYLRLITSVCDLNNIDTVSMIINLDYSSAFKAGEFEFLVCKSNSNMSYDGEIK